MKPVIFNNTVLRDGHQSLAATRMKTSQMLPALADLDSLEHGALETWGGATIDSCLRYLDENPFDRLDALKKGASKTPHMMLLRGQNIVQYTSFPDDVVEAFVRCSAEHGMDIFRIFDALNDLRNIQTAVKTAKAMKKHAQGVICYTTSPVHTLEAFVKLGIQIEEMGCDSICIKDMAGLISPSMTYDLVKELKKKCKIPVVLHSHNTAGMAGAAYYAAVEAGVDRLDVSIAPFANGSGQPEIVMMMTMLERSDRCPRYDRAKITKLQAHFETVYTELKEFTSPANEKTDSTILVNQIPGGMLSNFRTQLKDQGMADKISEVLAEMPYVRKCLGYIPLVTPTSQIVGTQAMMNVKFGRWKMVSQPAMDVVLGKYGRTPGPIDPELLAQVTKQSGQEPVTQRPADLLQPRMAKLKEELRAKNLKDSDENAVLYAMFPQQLEELGKPKAAPAAKPAAPAQQAARPASAGPRRTMSLTVNGKTFQAEVEEITT